MPENHIAEYSGGTEKASKKFVAFCFVQVLL